MTKEELVDLFGKSVSGNRPADDNIGIHENVLMSYLSLAYSDMIDVMIRKNPQGKYRSLDNYVYVDEKLALEETTTPSIFTLKPRLTPVAVAGQEGIRSVYPSGRPEDALSFRSIGAVKMMSDLYAELENRTSGSYSIYADGLYVYDYSEKCREFDVAVIAGIESLGWDQEIKLPQDGRSLLLSTAKELFLHGPPEDRVNDGR